MLEITNKANFKYLCTVQQEFEDHINKNFPIVREGTFLLACSGGVDSVVLAHLCAKSGLDFAIAHCNFGLRGSESDGDETFVENLAKDLGKTFFVTHFDTADYVKKHKVSVLMAARELRYNWFFELMGANGYKTVATAHQSDDDLETFLINLSRGTGIQGLIGIPALTDRICRPLLAFSREDIMDFARDNHILWREDSSNKKVKYLRNKIRHQIIPLLKELHPTFPINFTKTQHHLAQTHAILENHIEEIKSALFIKNGDNIKIPIGSIKHLNPIKGYLYELFKPYGFTEWEDVEGLLAAMSGKEVRSKTHRLLRDRDFLLLTEIAPWTNEVFIWDAHQPVLEHPIPISRHEVAGMDEISERILYVDKKTLKYPLTVRKWQKGDYFYPLGMRNKKKLSKFFKDEKISVIDKEKQWLLCSQNNIVWVVGKRADDRFKVTKNTKRIIKFISIE